MKNCICRSVDRKHGRKTDTIRWPTFGIADKKNHHAFFAVSELKGVFMLLFSLVFLFASIMDGDCQDTNTVLILGVRADAPPFSSFDDENGDGDPTQASGYTVDLCNRIAKRAVQDGLYRSFDYKKVEAADRFDALKNGEINMLCGASTVTLERMRVSDFSLFTFLSGASVMYREKKDPENDERANPLKVGVLGETTTEAEANHILQDLRKKNNNFGLPVHEKLKLQSFKNHYQGLEALKKEEIIAYVADREILLALRQKDMQDSHTTDIVVSEDYYTSEHYAIGLGIGNPDLRFIANSVLSELYDWDQAGNRNENIFTILSNNFPKKRFSKSLETLFRLQRITRGRKIPAKE
ncbi:transporter substrate-binding domain-containing protein [Desulfosarcina ovata]|nr:transporter substrate-binding domain-containing protein [Desulfosarcina ovata]